MKVWTTTRKSVFSPITTYKDRFFVSDFILTSAPNHFGAVILDASIRDKLLGRP